MVALLFFTEIGAVYPLLHILFGSQNPQRWISEKIAGLETDILSLEHREAEVAQVLDDLRAASHGAISSMSGIDAGQRRIRSQGNRTAASTSAWSALPT